MSEYEGAKGVYCDLCEEETPASHSCRTVDHTILVCELHYVRTKVEHICTDHKELPEYRKWLKANKSKQKPQPQAAGMF